MKSRKKFEKKNTIHTIYPRPAVKAKLTRDEERELINITPDDIFHKNLNNQRNQQY